MTAAAVALGNPWLANRVLEFEVHATPRPQGSKRFVGHAKSGRAIMVEMAGQPLSDWRLSVIHAARQALGRGERMTGPVSLEVAFRFARPKSHYGKRGLRPTAPVHHTQAPDASKILRSLEDALTEAGVWRDDALIWRVALEKLWAETSGASVRIEELR